MTRRLMACVLALWVAASAAHGAAGDRSGAPGEVDVQARLKRAGQLVDAGRLDEATGEYLWLWDNMLIHEPAMVGVRLSFMVSDMKKLAQGHAPAMAAFQGLRDRYWPAIEAGRADREALLDWISLNEVVGQEEVTLAWFDAVKDDPGKSAEIRMIRMVERDLYTLLVRRGRWADAGRVVSDPVEAARLRVEMNDRIMRTDSLMRQVPEKREAIQQMQKQRFRRDLMNLYASCLAAGREREGAGVAEILLREYGDGVARLELVQIALMMDKPRPDHARWLDEAEAEGEPVDELRAELAEALQRRGASD